MNALDFISESPKVCIFQKSSNKTNLGGILTLIYLIVLILIIIAYLFDFFTYEKYEYSYFYEYILKKSDRDKIKENPEFNQPINISFYFQHNKIDVSDDFIIFVWDESISEIKNRLINSKNIVEKPNDLDSLIFQIKHICRDEDCKIDKKYEADITKNDYQLILSYNTSVIDDDNDDNPIVNTLLNFTYKFSLENVADILLRRDVYNFEEKKDILLRITDYLLDYQNNYTFGKFEEVYTSANKNSGRAHCVINDRFCLNVINLKIENPLEGIHLYKRKKKLIWDYFANIAALGITIFHVFCKVFGFIYSKTFDNYKIVENILFNRTIRIKYKELNQSNIKFGDKLIDEDSIHNKLIHERNNSNDENIITNDEYNINDLLDENNKISSKLPELNFYHYFFNNIYCKCCGYIKKQKLISSCNEILDKYYSIENILFNQILFENLMKDYKWNNPELKSIHKNDLIISLKNYLI